MAANKGAKKISKGDASPPDKRGTSDDLEVLSLILGENESLRKKVLEKIRFIRGMSKERQKGEPAK